MKPFNEKQSNETFNCNVCELSFPSSDDLKRHVKEHTVKIKQEYIFECNRCEMTFQGDTDLKTHELSHLNANPSDSDVDQESVAEFCKAKLKYACDLCDKSYSSGYSLKIHKMTHSGLKPFKCDVCDKCFPRNWALESHKKVHSGERPYKCSFCDKSFALKYSLKTHEMGHSTEKPYECNVCYKTFALRHHLERHEMIHTNDKPFKCQHCDKSFTQKGNLKTHEVVHLDTKPCYKCVDCGKVLQNERSFIRHKNAHLKNKFIKIEDGVVDPIKLEATELPKPVEILNCDQCEKSFPSEKQLKWHKRYHAEKNYECNICGKLFLKPCLLKAHQVKHTGIKPYSCDICDQVFTHYVSIIRHKKQVHSAEKVLSCNVCNHVFTKQNKLDEHRMVHVDELPFRCKVCPKAYKSLDALDLHLQTKHNHKSQEDLKNVKLENTRMSQNESEKSAKVMNFKLENCHGGWNTYSVDKTEIDGDEENVDVEDTHQNAMENILLEPVVSINSEDISENIGEKDIIETKKDNIEPSTEDMIDSKLNRESENVVLVKDIKIEEEEYSDHENIKEIAEVENTIAEDPLSI